MTESRRRRNINKKYNNSSLLWEITMKTIKLKILLFSRDDREWEGIEQLVVMTTESIKKHNNLTIYQLFLTNYYYFIIIVIIIY